MSEFQLCAECRTQIKCASQRKCDMPVFSGPTRDDIAARERALSGGFGEAPSDYGSNDKVDVPTPRCDALEKEWKKGRGYGLPPNDIWTLARTLERELSTARSAGVSINDPETDKLVATLRDIAQAKEIRIAHIFKAAWRAADLIELMALRSTQSASERIDWHYEALHCRNALSSYGAALTRIKDRRCTNPKPVGDSACECCTHHWYAISDEERKYDEREKATGRATDRNLTP